MFPVDIEIYMVYIEMCPISGGHCHSTYFIFPVDISMYMVYIEIWPIDIAGGGGGGIVMVHIS